MSVLYLLIWFYVAMLATVLVHEFGHQGKKIRIMKWFPWIEGAAFDAKYWWGGLAVNFTMALTIYLIKPENIFLQLFGFMNWLHFVLYSILGSINYEPKVPPSLWKYFVFDDIENDKYGVIMISFGILAFLFFNSYYIPLLINIFQQAVL